MSTLEDLNAGPGGMVGLVSSLSRRFRPVTRRSLLVGAAVAGSALATKPKEYALRPVAAYATICGPGNTASTGWTVFCCTVNKGVNACPPGSFAAGWWKAADSSWCGGGYRYIVDCNASCSKCSSGCSDGICDSKCWSCSCGSGSKATCDQRRVCCNAFRYGQCNTQVKCSGGVHCRVVSCVAPYKWTNCTTTSLSDNRTGEHSAPCLPRWGPIEKKYIAMGAQQSYLKASTGPVRAVGDGKGSYVQYQGGMIITSSAHGTRPVMTWILDRWQALGGARGIMGYPTSERINGLKDGGWIQLFQGGAITDSASTTTQIVPKVMDDAWAAVLRFNGLLGYPTSGSTAAARGTYQRFQGGELWALSGKPARRVYGAVLTQWNADGGATGSYGFPVTDTVATSDGQLTCTFEDGTITA